MKLKPVEKQPSIKPAGSSRTMTADGKPEKGKTAFRVTFLGTADGHTSAKREHSGIIIETGKENLLLDCGAAAARYFLDKKIPADFIDVLWISHMHSDHNGQISALIQSLWLRQRRKPLQVFGPAMVLDAVKDWLERSLLFPELIGFPIEWRAVKPGRPYTHGSFRFTPFATEHLDNLASYFKAAYPGTCFECYGMTFEYEGKRYVYSADLAHPRELIPVLKGRKTAALLCELTHFPERDLFRELAPFDIESIWITHYPDRLESQEKQLKKIATEEKFRGSIHVVQDKVAQAI